MGINDIKGLLPFNSYDFFGYLIPGSIFLAGMAIWGKYENVEVINRYTNFILIGKEINIAQGISLCVIGLTVVYFIGHLIGTISHLLVDRILVRTIAGYPFQRLLGIVFRRNIKTHLTVLFLLYTLFIILITPSTYDALNKFLKVTDIYVFSIKMMFFLFAITSFILFGALILPYKNKNRRLPKFGKTVFHILLQPFSSLKIFAACNGVFDKKMSKMIIKKISDTHGLNVTIRNSEAYWQTTISLQNDPHVNGKMVTWLNLYGFLKNFSIACLLLCIIISGYQWYSVFMGKNIISSSRMFFVFLSFSFLLGIRYWIIYRNYYTKYLLRAIYNTPSKVSECKIIL